MFDLKVPIGVDFKTPLELSGVSPDDLITPFDVDSFTFSAYIKYDDEQDLMLNVSTIEGLTNTLCLHFPASIYTNLDHQKLLPKQFDLIIKGTTLLTTTTTTTTPAEGETPAPSKYTRTYVLCNYKVAFSPEV